MLSKITPLREWRSRYVQVSVPFDFTLIDTLYQWQNLVVTYKSTYFGTHPYWSLCSFTPRLCSVNSILHASSARREISAPSIINPQRSEGETSIPNPTGPVWDNCCLVTLFPWLACVATVVSKIPHSLWHFSDSGVFIPGGDRAFGHTHVAPAWPISQESVSPCCLHADVDWSWISVSQHWTLEAV